MSATGLASWLALSLLPAAAGASDGAPTGRLDDGLGLVAQARAATAKYRDRDVAIADGYRLIGEEFPGMGEHWIHIGLLFDGAYDPDRPEFLTYVTLDGAPRLLGVAYALPLLAGEEPPEAPAGRAAWHAHAASVDDETLVPRHHHSGHQDQGPRLAMVHAWIWLENPEGLFAADNWAIPFLRAGLTVPARARPAAGKALSLLGGGGGYVARVVRAAAAPDAVDEAALGAVIAQGLRRVGAVVERRSGPVLGDADLDALAAAWEEMWRAIEAMLPADAVERVRSQSMR